MNAKNVVSQSKEKKAKKKIGNVPAPTAATSTQDPKAKPSFKLPSQTEMLKNPMKYVGVAVKAFQQLNEQVEKQGEAIVQIAKHIQDSDEKLAPLVNAIEQANAARAQNPQGPNPMPAAGGGIGALMRLLPAILSGGGGENPMMQRFMELSMKRMESDIGFAEAIKNAVVSKIAGKAAAGLTE